ncbi:uncharacterized protein LOC126907627 isoform X2 [Daktulosphaira vitifoliae]|uniref:uncharacterized protein LOC126907627 isoform X2 n=1 Tax=Daktulosphaira vitifoliae TaxID=58002 RepID=UPI0021AADD06|nr:uncharacterized protein LOC126907627 isoform X2 [Daktulosphaira vitifoliae]
MGFGRPVASSIRYFSFYYSNVQNAATVFCKIKNDPKEKALSQFDEEEVNALINKTTYPPRSIIGKLNLFSSITKSELLSIEKKLNVKEKYESKKKSLQCINTLILNAMVWNIKNSLLINEMPNLDKLEVFEKYKMYLSRMLSVLYYGRIRAKRWLTYLYTKLLNIADTEKNEKIMQIKFINNESLLSDIEDDYNKCESSYFIPKPRRLIKDEFYSFYKVFDIIEQLYNNEEMNQGYIYENLFSMENMTLYFLKDQYKVIFGQMTVGQFNWQENMNDMEHYNKYINTIYKKNEWIIEPFRAKLRYHLMFQEIVFTHILQYISIHMQQFFITCSTKAAIMCYNCSSIHISINQYRNLWYLIAEPLKNAIELLGFKDTLLNQILIHFETKSSNLCQYKTLLYQVKILHRRCLRELHVPIKKNTEYQLNLDGPRNEFDQFAIESNFSKFVNYVKEVKTLLKPINSSLFFIRFLYQDVFLDYKFKFFPYICKYSNC